jgi:hypothetical protein
MGGSTVNVKTLALCAALVPSALAAQGEIPRAIRKGSAMIGGSANFSQQRSDDTRVTSLNVNPMLLRFVGDGIAIGGSAGLSRQSSENVTTNGWSLGPAAQAFFGARTSEWLPFVVLSVRIGASETDGASGTLSSTQRVIDGAFGVMRLLGDQVGFDAELFYTDSRFSAELDFVPVTTDSKQTRFGVRFGFSAFLLQR